MRIQQKNSVLDQFPEQSIDSAPLQPNSSAGNCSSSVMECAGEKRAPANFWHSKLLFADASSLITPQSSITEDKEQERPLEFFPHMLCLLSLADVYLASRESEEITVFRL